MENSVNVQTIMQEIRERIRQRSAPSAAPEFSPSFELPEMSLADTVVQSLDSCKSRVGELPPQPSSFRGTLGALLVKIVRRMLFWYTPQIREFQAGVVAGFEQQLAALRALLASTQQNGSLLLEVQNRLEKLRQALAAETRAREQMGKRLMEEREAREALSLATTGKSRQQDLAIQQLRAENSHQSARISILLEETRKRGAAGEPQPPSDEDLHKLDGFYIAFEDRFRGTQAQIAERLRVYLPWLKKHQIGTRLMPILDLGCGRGEWLAILAESGLEGYGVDTNRIVVAQCQERGLRVVEADILQHLRSVPDNSLGAVTGFHIIEHLPVEVLINVIDEAVRVLKPGGLAIFETPNPQNVLVGSHNFYLDPTHRRPIPCLVAQFLLEARGFCDVEIVQLHPYAECYRVPDSTELAQKFNDYFYGPQDYAVIGRRV